MKVLRILVAIVVSALAGRAGGQTLTTLVQFGGTVTNGLSPLTGLVQGIDGDFYGTTLNGGTNGDAGGGYGTVFKITSQGTLTTLWQFGGVIGDGQNPQGGLVQGSDGYFYSTTHNGGTNGPGTVFRITSQGTLTTLWQFGGISGDARAPEAGLVQGSDSNFYGTTQSGGTHNIGTVFRITPQGTLTTLYQFGGLSTDGRNPKAGLVQGSDSNFYGTTSQGGLNTFGTVFRITPQGTLTTLYQFGNHPTDGRFPEAKLVQGSDSNFYGTTVQGGTNGFGTVFRITSQGTLTTLWQFGDLPTGSRSPQAGLIQGNDGNFYGTTSGSGSGPRGKGTVFKITSQGTLTTLWQFGGMPPLPSVPQGGLVQGSDSNFYGTTVQGGTNYDGTVFKMTSQGTLTVLHDFGGLPNDGVQPLSAMVQSSDGNFYGTTYNGGTNGVGTVFRMSPSGSVTTLWSFCSIENGSQFGGCLDGQDPSAGLVQGSDGSFYGTTQSGGTSFDGNVFRISPDGSFTNLHWCTGGDSGQSPNGLVQGSDGWFYGTTTFGGSCLDSCGIVFKISAQGTFAMLHDFATFDGQYPDAALVQGSDGWFYGTTSSGGSNACWCGTVFKISTQGTLTTLYNFGSFPSDGIGPFAKLVQGSDGAFYGTTPTGGTNNLGTVFRITSQGTLTTLWQFGVPPSGGKNPYAALVQGYDGDFYGTTGYGGTNDQGTVFKLSVPLTAPPFPINQITNGQVAATNIIFDIVSIAGETYQLQFSNSMNPTNWINVPGVSVTNSLGALLTVTNFGGATQPQGFYRFGITP